MVSEVYELQGATCSHRVVAKRPLSPSGAQLNALTGRRSMGPGTCRSSEITRVQIAVARPQWRGSEMLFFARPIALIVVPCFRNGPVPTQWTSRAPLSCTPHWRSPRMSRDPRNCRQFGAIGRERAGGELFWANRALPLRRTRTPRRSQDSLCAKWSRSWRKKAHFPRERRLNHKGGFPVSHRGEFVKMPASPGGWRRSAKTPVENGQSVGSGH